MDGTATVRGIPVSVDVSFDEILSNLEFGTMVNYRAEKDKLSLGVDVIYMGLGARTPGGLASVDFDQWMVEGNAGWRLGDHAELIGGLRYNSMDATIQALVGGQPSASQSKSWIDPFVGGRLWFPLSDSFLLIFRGDIGGFSVGSELAWQLAGYFAWDVSNSVSLLAGYRALDVDYVDGQGTSRFEYDMLTHGPAAGLTWRF